MKVKNIAVITPQLYPFYIGGVEVFNYYILLELSKDYQVEYVSYDKLKSITSKHFRLSKGRFLKYLHLLLWITILALKKRVFVLSFSRSNVLYWLIFPLLNILLGTKYVIIIHGGGLTGLKKNVIYNYLFKRSTKLFGVSEVICKKYNESYNIQVDYLPPVIPFKQSDLSKEKLRLNYSLPIDSKLFLYVGSLKKLKRPEVVVDAFVSLGYDYLEKYNIYLIIAGDGPMRQYLIDIVNYYKLNKYIKFLGNVERNSIPDLYRMSDCYIISSDFEGTPISMLEAMYNKLTIIAANSQGINDIIINECNGLLFNNNSTYELTKLLKLIIEEDVTTKYYCRNAYSTYLEKFSFTDTINKIKIAISL